MLEPQLREHRSLVNVTGNLLGAALGGDVLDAYELRAAALTGKAQQVVSHGCHCPARAFLPRRVGG